MSKRGRIPMPKDTAIVFSGHEKSADNFGLLFDRYVRYQDDWSFDGEHKSTEAFELIKKCNLLNQRSKEMYRALADRQKAMFSGADNRCRSFTAVPEWRLAIGLGNDSAFETGITLHPVFGCPFVPGSALKGMTRAWAIGSDQIQAFIKAEKLDTTPQAIIDRLFGPESDSDADHAGTIVFYDAIPITPPQLQLDMINPHYTDYYQKEGKQKEYPSDWQSPKPVYFITVSRQTKFRFAVGGRSAVNVSSADIDLAQALLKMALQEMGVGGKTTSGYGYWQV